MKKRMAAIVLRVAGSAQALLGQEADLSVLPNAAAG